MKLRNPIGMEKLKSCPFCGSSDLVLENLVDANDFFVHCNGCDVQQIANYTAPESIRRWNKRISADAKRCAELASETALSYDLEDGLPSHHAVGAETVAVRIRREFGLDDHAGQFDVKAAASEMYEALRARMLLEDEHANCDECNGECEPEACEHCVPFADDARLKMRAAIAKLEAMSDAAAR